MSWSSGGSVTSILNPITRSMVRIDPPFFPRSHEDLDQFMKYFTAYCEACWQMGWLDPKELPHPEVGWRHFTPSDVKMTETENEWAVTF